MAELLPCPFCGGVGTLHSVDMCENVYAVCMNCGIRTIDYKHAEQAIRKWNTRTPKERGVDKQKITCLNCKHLMFSDMYGECNKQLRIVNPGDTCEFAEPKERGRIK